MLFEFNFDIFRRGFILTEKKKGKKGSRKGGSCEGYSSSGRLGPLKRKLGYPEK